MTSERTQHQTDDEWRRAQQLSLQRTQPPSEVPGYQIQRFLGAGAYGEVWIGTDANTGRRVAVKFFLHRGGVNWSLLSKEVEKLVFLSADRYVVQLLDVGWDADPPFYVMEYVEHGSLDRYLRDRNTLSVEESVELFREITVGLMHAHGKGVLHCDLKPANILLDQDHKPRLADFGQSRLSHEQIPSLGTLFYMAPEQAHLDAVPDARWDVYALGAILYCMLTGAPPHRTEANISEIDTAGDLNHRLEKYRNAILAAPPPAAHQEVVGIDRGLSDIVDGCLATNTDERFANVQEVLHALDERDKQRARRPLLLLGLVSPTLLLVIMVIFSGRLYKRAITKAENTVTTRVHDGNQWVANHVARRIEDEFQRYFEIIEQESDQPEFQDLVVQVEKNPLIAQLQRTDLVKDKREQLQSQFLNDQTRQKLRAYLQRRLNEYIDSAEQSIDDPRLASVFVVDQKGTMLAVAYDRDVATKSVGKNYSWRTYFHGGDDLKRSVTPLQIEPIKRTSLSAVFQSTTTKLWKVAVSRPIKMKRPDGTSFLGVMAITVNLGDFPYIRSKNQQHRFAVLIDGRRGDRRGTILQHPLFDGKELLSPDYLRPELRVSEAELLRLRDGKPLYHDPMAQTRDGSEYEGDWIAAVTGVKIPNQPSSSSNSNKLPRLIVLVQESYSAATSPLHQFGKLVLEGLLAIGSVLIVVGAVWFFVGRSLGRPNTRVRHSPSDPTPVHDLTTLAAPGSKPNGGDIA